MVADRQKNTNAPVATLTLSIGLRNRRRWSIGESTLNSTRTKATPLITEIPKAVRIAGEAKPRSWPSVKARESDSSETLISPAPTTSNRCPGTG